MISLDTSVYLLPQLKRSLSQTGQDEILYYGYPDRLTINQLAKHLSAQIDILLPSMSASLSSAPPLHIDPAIRPALRTQSTVDIQNQIALWTLPAATSVHIEFEHKRMKTKAPYYGLGILDMRACDTSHALKRFSRTWPQIRSLGILCIILETNDSSSQKNTEMMRNIQSIAPDLDMYELEGCLIIHKPDEGLQSYHNKHTGQRVYIIGNGPSLAETDLDLIENEPSIAMNRIPLIYEKTKWRPTYYLMVSDNVRHPEWGESWIKSVNMAVDYPLTHCFIAEQFTDILKTPEKVTSIKCMTEYRIGQQGSFSRNASQYLSKTGTTMNMAFQLAYFMGFKEVILLGADMNWQTLSSNESDSNHFDPTYGANIPNGERERIRMRNTHSYANSMFRKDKRHIINASLNTMIDVYPLKQYDLLVNSPCPLSSQADDPTYQMRRQELERYWATYRSKGLLKDYM